MWFVREMQSCLNFSIVSEGNSFEMSKVSRACILKLEFSKQEDLEIMQFQSNLICLSSIENNYGYLFFIE